MRKAITLLLTFITLVTLSACGASADTTAAAKTEETSSPAEPDSSAAGSFSDLSGHTLLIYCGAGMTDPFSEIAAAFENETRCTLEVAYANAGQAQTQIKTAQEGDFFIAGSSDELKPVSDFITHQTDLVRHIPVLAVASGNPKHIAGLKDLAAEGITVVLGDGESTPIGKIADKALDSLGITEQVDVIARSATAPAMANALATGACDAAIVWKENASKEAIEIVDTPDLDQFIKTIPAGSLSFTKDDTACRAFLEFLGSDGVKAIWTRYGYEIIN